MACASVTPAAAWLPQALPHPTPRVVLPKPLLPLTTDTTAVIVPPPMVPRLVLELIQIESCLTVRSHTWVVLPQSVSPLDGHVCCGERGPQQRNQFLLGFLFFAWF